MYLEEYRQSTLIAAFMYTLISLTMLTRYTRVVPRVYHHTIYPYPYVVTREISTGRFVSATRTGVAAVGKKTVSMSKTMVKMTKAAYRDPAVVGHWMEDLGASVRHGWKWVKNGFKLFSKNLVVSKRLIWKAAMGHQLSLRESKLLVTTTSDLFKLVPFSLFIIIPFAELALPLFLRLFPNMLPSTFTERGFDSASVARRVRAKKELAEFFHTVIEERNRQDVESIAASSASSEHRDKTHEMEELRAVLAKPFPSVKELVRFSKLFEDDFKLENMPLDNVQQICRLLGIEPFAFKAHVVLQLRHYVNGLQAEDRRIMWEGVDSLTLQELQEACHARGMPPAGEEEMRRQLDHWLQLSSCREIPISLLLWSRACFKAPDTAANQPPPLEEEADEELFEETAERQKERAEDVERRLEKLEKLVGEDGPEGQVEEERHDELDRDELVRRNSSLEAELEVMDAVVQKQELIIADQIAVLAKLHALTPDKVTDELPRILTRFQLDVAEVEQLLDKHRGIRMGIDDQRYYPAEDDVEEKGARQHRGSGG